MLRDHQFHVAFQFLVIFYLQIQCMYRGQCIKKKAEKCGKKDKSAPFYIAKKGQIDGDLKKTECLGSNVAKYSVTSQDFSHLCDQ